LELSSIGQYGYTATANSTRGSFGSKKIAIEGDRSPFIVANQGYRDVIAMIVQFGPDLVVPNTRSDRFFERFAQRSVWWRRV